MPRLLGGIGGAARGGPWTLPSKVPSLPECGNGKAAPWIRVLSDGEETEMHQLFLLCVFARARVCVSGEGEGCVRKPLICANRDQLSPEISCFSSGFRHFLDSYQVRQGARIDVHPFVFFPPQVTKS